MRFNSLIAFADVCLNEFGSLTNPHNLQMFDRSTPQSHTLLRINTHKLLLRTNNKAVRLSIEPARGIDQGKLWTLMWNIFVRDQRR